MNNIFLLFIFVQCVLCRNLDTDLVDQILQLNNQNVKPVGINQNEITVFVYTQAQPNGVEVALADANKLTDVSPFNTKLKTIFYIHGWNSHYDKKGSLLVRQTLLEHANVNVLIVNWDKCADNIDYFIAVGCVGDTGKYLGQFVEAVTQTYGYSLNDITVVGHSLGAHVAGFIGKSTNGALGTIVGLDPAGPFFFEENRDARLTEDDAQYVQAIHTCATYLGVKFSCGNADFWPNSGWTQNGCSSIDIKCSHDNAWRYYVESISNNGFYAKQCDSYDDYEKGHCGQGSKSLMGGLEVNTAATGNYYLDTNAQSPYGKGDI